MRIALAQLNFFVGDMAGNEAKILGAMKRAASVRADVLVTPELGVTGYPPEDLLHRDDFIDANLKSLARLVKASRRFPKLTSVVGYVDRQAGKLYNAAAWVGAGKVMGKYHKQILPNYGVFDEWRYFKVGRRPPIFNCHGDSVGLTICEDLWEYDGAAAQAVREAKVNILISINASPFEMGKRAKREKLLAKHAKACGALTLYLNTVGAQDELVFDGQSMVLSPKGKVLGRGEAFKEDFLVVDTKRRIVTPKRKSPAELEEAYSALVLGTKEYARKNGFSGGVLGVSGGIDSALTAAIAVDALGAQHVHGVVMPSRYTSRDSVEDARELAQRLRIPLIEISIEPMFQNFLEALGVLVEGESGDLARQNLQARVRGAILMALSNRYGCLVLATGNKSEMSVGYATLYGDMAGGFAVLKDVPKALVYRLAKWRNARKAVIPKRVLTKSPSAELRPDQKDSDSLPPYPVLDPILKAYVEDAKSLAKIGRRPVAGQVARMVEKSEYKRRQAPPGVKIGPKAFGRDRRVPISHGFRPWK